MKSEGKTYVQCQSCGQITVLNEQYNIEELFLKDYECLRCGHTVGLNLGDKQDDIYIYMNSNADYRYYEY